MIHHIITRKITEIAEDLERSVAGGCAHSFEEYRYHTGRIKGLKDALDICADIVKETKE